MTLTLPPELANLVSQAGGRFPEADEDRLSGLGDAWRSLSRELTVLKDRGSTIGEQIVSSHASSSIDRFGEQWREFERQFDTAINAAEACASGSDAMARAVLSTKQAIAEVAAVVYRKILELRRMAGLSGAGLVAIAARAILMLLRFLGRHIWRFLVALAKLIWRGIVWLFKKAWEGIKAVGRWLARLFKGKGKPPPAKRAPQPRDRQPPTGSKWDVGSSKLPNMHGKGLAEAERELAKQGFKGRPPTAGGYRRYDHPDGSTVWIRPNGEVIRLGPKINPGPNSKNYHPRYDREGGVTESHNTGEMVNL